MRTTLSGCKLAEMRGMIGAVDDELIEELRKWIDEHAGGERETFEEIAKKLKGQPAAELEDEGYAGYIVADALRHGAGGDKPPRTRFEVKDALWFDLLDNHKKAIGGDAELFGYLAEGRPLFGQANSDAVYACFDREEAIRIRDAARRIAASPRADKNLVEIMTDEHEGLAPCIDKILDAGFDLWTEAS